ncbi:MAG: universal stress protein [Rubripirellula sp.]
MKIIIPTSGEEAAEEIVDYMMSVAKRMSAGVVAVHIDRDNETQADGERACKVFHVAGQKSGVDVSSQVVDGDVIEAFVNVATESSADLILMGASRGKVVDDWLSAGVMQKCDVPVLVVPHCYGSQS